MNETSCQYCGISYLLHSKIKELERRLHIQGIELSRLQEKEENSINNVFVKHHSSHTSTEIAIESPINNTISKSYSSIASFIKTAVLKKKEKLVIDSTTKSLCSIDSGIQLVELVELLYKRASHTPVTVVVKEKFDFVEFKLILQQLYKVALIHNRKTISVDRTMNTIAVEYCDYEQQTNLLVYGHQSVQTDKIKEVSKPIVVICCLKLLLKETTLAKSLPIPNVLKLKNIDLNPIVSSICFISATLKKLSKSINSIETYKSTFKASIPYNEVIGHTLFSIDLNSIEQHYQQHYHSLLNQPNEPNKLSQLEVLRLAQLVKLQCEERQFLLGVKPMASSLPNIHDPSTPTLSTEIPESIGSTESTIWQKMMTRKKIRK